MTFATKAIDVTITLGEGQFGESQGNSVLLQGYRVQANILAYTGYTSGTLNCRIYGMPLELMTQLTVIGALNFQIRLGNAILIAAGDEDSGALSTVFSGTIMDAWADFSQFPETALNILAYSAGGISVLPIQANSFPGPWSVPNIINKILGQINDALPEEQQIAFNPGNVTTMLTNMYTRGGAWDQIKQVMRAANCYHKIDDQELTIWQLGTDLGDSGVILSPQTGLVGYPQFSSNGVGVKCLFNPSIQTGQFITLQNSTIINASGQSVSTIPAADGQWRVTNVNHCLESIIENGSWFTNFVGVQPQSN